MVLLALFPPLWFHVMDRRLDAWQAQRTELESTAVVEAAA
jgi:hypothetical protein